MNQEQQKNMKPPQDHDVAGGYEPGEIARRQFLKAAGGGLLAAGVPSAHLHAEPQKQATAAAASRAPWAYTGTDNDPGVKLYPLTPYNSLPALVVWLTMTASADLQNNITDNQLQQLADAVGLTKNSVASIHNLITTGNATGNAAPVSVGDAFATVAQVLLEIGIPQGSKPYTPSTCPALVDILSFGPAAIARDPQPQ